MTNGRPRQEYGGYVHPRPNVYRTTWPATLFWTLWTARYSASWWRGDVQRPSCSRLEHLIEALHRGYLMMRIRNGRKARGMLGVVDRVVDRPSGCWGHRHIVCWERLGFSSLASMEFLDDAAVLAFLCQYGSDFAVFCLVELESFPIGLTCTSSPLLSRNADVIPS